MFSYETLAELSRQRRLGVAQDVARCHHVRSPRVAVGRALVALGALTVVVGLKLDDETERKPEITIA